MFLYRSSPRIRISTRRAWLGEKNRRLAGGIAATYNDYLAASAQMGLGEGRGIVDAGALESSGPWHIQPAIVCPSGDQQALGRHRLASVQPHQGVGVLEGQSVHQSGDGQMGAEFVGLEDGAASQFTARQTGGKAKVVFDSHTAASLAAGCGVFEYGGAEPFRGAINSGREAGWTGAHDYQVVDPVFKRLADADGIGELPVGGIPQKQHPAAGDDGGIGLGHPELPEQPVHIRDRFQRPPR